MSTIVGLIGLVGLGAFFVVLKILKRRLYAYVTLGASLLLTAIGLNPGLIIGVGIAGLIAFAIWIAIAYHKDWELKDVGGAFQRSMPKVFPAVALGVSVLFIFIGSSTLKRQNRIRKLDRLYISGTEAYDAKNFESAVDLLSKVKTRHPRADTILQRIPKDAFEYYCNAGQDALEGEMFDRAMGCFQSALKWNPQADSLLRKVRVVAHEHYSLVGEEALKKNELHEAIESFQSALKWKPNDARTVKFLADAKSRLGDRLFKEGRKAYAGRDYELAVQKFIDAKKMGHESAHTWLNKAGDAQQRREKARAEAEERREKARAKVAAKKRREKARAEEAAARKAYQGFARNSFLDMGWDIKVRVHGPQYKYITLTWILMDDVFIHNFKKSPMFNEMYYDMGFRRVYYKDGYDFSKYTYWDD